MKKAPKIKRKGYYRGTEARGIETNSYSRGSDESMDAIDVDENGNALTEELDASGQPKQKSGAGKAAISGALGSIGSGYYGSQKAEDEGEAVYNAGMGAVSKMGAIGGIIGGAAAVGDQIGKPIRKETEKVNEKTGKYDNKGAAIVGTTVGSFFNPFKSLTTTLSDKNAPVWKKALAVATGGGGTGALSINEKGDVAELERLKKEKEAQAQSDAMALANQDLMARRNAGETGAVALSTYRAPKAKGGVVKGKGTTTSDSINAELGSGDFVVPAKNREMGERIASEVGMRKGGTAELHKGKVPVKLSKDELVIDKKTKNKIVNKFGEEVLEELAPEAEEGTKLKHGGDVEDENVDPKKELAKMDAEQKASAQKRQLDYQNSKDYKEKIGRYKDRISATKKWQSEYARLNKAVEVVQKEYNEIQSRGKDKSKRLIGENDNRNTEYKKKALQRLQVLIDERDKAKSVYDFTSDDKNYDTSGNIKSVTPQVKSNLTSAGKIGSKAAKAIFNNTEKPSVTSPAKASDEIAGTKPKTNSTAQDIWANSLKPSNKFIEDTGDYPSVPSLEKTEIADATSEIANPNKNAVDTNPVKTTPKTNFWDKVSGINTDGALSGALNYGLGAYQISKGLKGLKGERPIAKIDPTFSANVDTAQANAKFGYTAEQNFLIDQNNQNLLDAGRFSARNYSGGSGGNAFNMERTAINDSFTRGLEAKSANTQLQQSKLGLAAGLAAQRAGMSRQIFEDSLNAFTQKQAAAGNLLGTGISNIADANRFSNYMKLRNQEQDFNNQYG